MGAVPQQLPFWQSYAVRANDGKGPYSSNLLKDVRFDGEWAQQRSGVTYQFTAGGAFDSNIGLVATRRTGFTIDPSTRLLVAGVSVDAVTFVSAGEVYITGSDGSRNLLSSGGTLTVHPYDAVSFVYYTITGTFQFIASCSSEAWSILIANGNASGADIPAMAFPKGMGIAYLDGTLYVMDTSLNGIRGSTIQDYTTWPALNIVSTGNAWGAGVACYRHLNYILGFFQKALQVYYNAGLAPPGSPLAPLPNASFLIGCLSPKSIVSMADVTIFVGTSTAGNKAVYMLSGLSLTIISPSSVNNYLQLHSVVTRVKSSEDAWIAYTLVDKGHVLYVLKVREYTVNEAGTAYTGFRDLKTFVYDFTSQEWSIFTTNQLSVESPFKPNFSSLNYVIGEDLKVNLYDDSATVDTTGPILAETVGPVMNFQSAYKKFIHKFSLHGDTIVGKAVCQYSDDDYTTYSAAVEIDLSKQRKMINRQGSFYNRSYRIQYSQGNLYRMRGMEVLVEGGSA